VTSPRDNHLRYSRNQLVEEIGASGQETLSASSVLVVGAGGLGSPVLFYLAAAGVGRLGVMDGDRIEASNLNRQILHPADRVGMWKAASAEATLSAFNPGIRIESYPEYLTADNALGLFRKYDAVVDGCDNFGAKFLLNDAAVVTGTPLVHAGVLRFGGQLMTIRPGKGPCLRCLLPEVPPYDESGSSARVGIVGAAAGIVGAWQAVEVVKLLTGAGDPVCGRLLSIDSLRGNAATVSIPRDPACPACGESPSIGDPLAREHYIQKGSPTE
jgi:adenylyltransferase/sulfurtransferase